MSIITATIALALFAVLSFGQSGEVRVYATDNRIDTFSALVKCNLDAYA